MHLIALMVITSTRSLRWVTRVVLNIMVDQLRENDISQGLDAPQSLDFRSYRVGLLRHDNATSAVIRVMH